MNGVQSGFNAGNIAAIYLTLFFFGIVYNELIAWTEQKGYLHGYTALAVVGGVVVTLIMTAIISPICALLAAGSFVASGTPMIIGSIWRHVREREARLQKARKEIQDEHAGETLAE